jgi:hypothetical protein
VDAAELQAKKDAVADGDARARLEEGGPGDRRRGRGIERASIKVHETERPPG